MNLNNIIANYHHKNILIDYFFSINSTNDHLHKKACRVQYHICIGEHQSQGKGRFNRYWNSPFAQNIYFSLKTTLHININELSNLSLAISCVISDILYLIGYTLSIF